MKRHVASILKEKKPFKCESCNNCFSKNGSLKTHVLLVHEGKRPISDNFVKMFIPLSTLDDPDIHINSVPKEKEIIHMKRFFPSQRDEV